MKARRTFAGCIAAACVLGGTLGMAQHTSSDVRSTSSGVGLGTAVTLTSVCVTSVDAFPDAGWPQVGESTISDALALACDYRVTGQPCEQDEVCAVQVIRETGDFGGGR